MAVICPSILAGNEKEYHEQVDKIVHSAHRIQIDLTDGVFAPHQTVKPEQAWWPVGFKADFHLMYKNPADAIKTIMEHKPNLIIVHAEAEGNFSEVANFCHHYGVRVGIALLQDTPAEKIVSALNDVDHVLIFSGSLGNYGGHANLSLLSKVNFLKQQKPDLEIGWDGGVNDQNTSQLISGGVDVLSVGGFIQNAEDPAKAYSVLQRIADETGTT